MRQLLIKTWVLRNLLYDLKRHLLNALENERNELKHINDELEKQKRDSHASFEKTSVKVDIENHV